MLYKNKISFICCPTYSLKILPVHLIFMILWQCH